MKKSEIIKKIIFILDENTSIFSVSSDDEDFEAMAELYRLYIQAVEEEKENE